MPTLGFGIERIWGKVVNLFRRGVVEWGAWFREAIDFFRTFKARHVNWSCGRETVVEENPFIVCNVPSQAAGMNGHALAAA